MSPFGGVALAWRPKRGTQHQSGGKPYIFKVGNEGKETEAGKRAKGKHSQFPASRAPTTGDSG